MNVLVLKTVSFLCLELIKQMHFPHDYNTHKRAKAERKSIFAWFQINLKPVRPQ